MLFNELNIIQPILDALVKQGYEVPTPIQTKAIPPLLLGNDMLGCAQTGTGKTAAFSIPILQNLFKNNETNNKRKIKALIVAPTRELATQIGDSFVEYGINLPLKTAVIFGGVNQNPQVNKLRAGVDILVATPGRLLDLINQRFINLGNVEYFVLDEADHMLDMGMINDVKKIISYLPIKRQNMLFSATMPKEIEQLANTILKNPIKIEITPEFTPIDIIEQSVYFVDKEKKPALLFNLLGKINYDSVLIFTRTKHGADKIVKELNRRGFASLAIHGNKSQSNREHALNSFKDRSTRILVATDIAARGLDIQGLSHVFNYNLPDVPETYVHRVGRTGRAGLGGIAITLCDLSEKPLLIPIQKLINKTIPEVKEHPFPMVNTNADDSLNKAPKLKPASINNKSKNKNIEKVRETNKFKKVYDKNSKPKSSLKNVINNDSSRLVSQSKNTELSIEFKSSKSRFEKTSNQISNKSKFDKADTYKGYNSANKSRSRKSKNTDENKSSNTNAQKSRYFNEKNFKTVDERSISKDTKN